MSLRPNNYRLAIGVRLELAAMPGPTPQRLRSQPFPHDVEERLAVLDEMFAALTRSKLPRFDSLEAVFGFPHVRHLALPWQDAIVTPAERRLYAQAMVAEEHGIEPEQQGDWHCLLAQESFGQACIAGAVHGTLVDAITTSANKHGLRLRPLRTLLAETIACHQGPLPRDAVFMVSGVQGCEFAFRRDGQWLQAFALRRGQGGQGSEGSEGGLQSDAECLRSAALLARHFPASMHIGVSDLVEGGHAV